MECHMTACSPNAQTSRCLIPTSRESQTDTLTRLVRMCRQGDIAGAELELSQSVRRDETHPGEHVLLAALRAQRHDMAGAFSALHKALNDELDVPAGTVRMVMALLIEADLQESARDLALHVLPQRHDADAMLVWMSIMAVPGIEEFTREPAGIEALTSQLCQHIDVLPSLVAAMVQRPALNMITLLRSAAARVVDDLENQDACINTHAALAELAMLAEDHLNAAMWAWRGLKLSPMHARMAMIAADAERLSPQSSGHAPANAPQQASIDALYRINQIHPEYPDVFRALHRLESAA